MNEFTKQELLEIYGLLEHHYCNPELCLNPNPKLLIKLQSMIDNYCEHKWDNSCCGCTLGIYCEKCSINLVEREEQEENDF